MDGGVGTSRGLAETFALARAAFADGAFRTARMHASLVADLLQDRDLRLRQASSSQVAHSIVLVTHRHSDDVLRMLEALQRYAAKPLHELVVVNNGNRHLEALLDQMGLDCTAVDAGFNYGCSGGRNLGARFARGEDLIFVDDDGVLEKEAIEELIRCRRQFDAVTVRGRIVPKTDPRLAAQHYDKGRQIIPSIPDTEGLSVWHRASFLEFGGFDVLLSGHEGLCLACKMFRFFGPRYFLYTPDAVLRHDFSASEERLREKTKLHQDNREYLDHLGLQWREIVKTVRDFSATRETRAAFISTARYGEAASADASAPISVLTTARNGREFVEDFSASLRRQTHGNFEIVFVDDGSTDGTADAMAGLWRDDGRLRLIRSEAVGRGAALTKALEAARNDICAIADIDDISVPHRLAWTAAYFRSHPESCCVGFSCFNDRSPVRLARPYPIEATSIKARSLIGMPVAFPAFAFRRSDFGKPFDAALEAGIDCEWIFRNLADTSRDGHLIPIPAVYYRVHAGQITTEKRDIQRNQALACVSRLHTRLANGAFPEDSETLALLSGWTPIERGAQLGPVLEYTYALMSVADRYPGCCPIAARKHLQDTYLWLQEHRMRDDYRKLKEAHDRALNQGASKPASGLPSTFPHCETDYGWLSLRRAFFPIGYLAVAVLGNKRDRQKFVRSPAAFFDALKNAKQRELGLLFFPKKSETTR